MTRVAVTRENEVATVTISNPDRKNALSTEACVTLADALGELAHDNDIRCVVVTGQGDAFCSGIDLTGKTNVPNPSEELERGLNAVAISLLRMEKPTVANVTGPAVGAGASLATACDFVYAADSATFCWGFTEIGLAPDTGATYILPRLVGLRTAMELLTTARTVDAAQAVELGIANEQVPPEELDQLVAERVEMLCSRPTKAVGEAKRLLLRSYNRSLEAALHAEAMAQDRAFTSEDFAEGLTAFIEDREPEFSGR